MTRPQPGKTRYPGLRRRPLQSHLRRTWPGRPNPANGNSPGLPNQATSARARRPRRWPMPPRNPIQAPRRCAKEKPPCRRGTGSERSMTCCVTARRSRHAGNCSISGRNIPTIRFQNASTLCCRPNPPNKKPRKSGAFLQIESRMFTRPSFLRWRRRRSPLSTKKVAWLPWIRCRTPNWQPR